MCGICGYIGDKVKETLIEKLSMLEYRGYDSCGIAFFENENLKVIKTTKKIADLNEKIANENIKSIGIGHTRWATHGLATEDNAHPHTSINNQWAVVHNGIIENYMELKAKYLKNVNFKSQTDSEVIPCLLEKNENNIYSFITTCNILKGSYALCAINQNTPDTMYLAKNQSPLYVAVNENETLCASDTYCFENFVDYYELKDNEFATCKKNKITFYDNKGRIIKKNKIINKVNKYFSLKANFSSMMEKEINEIPFCIDNIISHYSKNKIKLSFDIEKIDNIKLIGCGSAYHTALIGEKFFKCLNKEVNTYVASEFRYSKNNITKNTLCIFVSQSGETADTIACLKQVKNKCKTLAIVNAENSTLRYLSDNSLFMLCGKEVAVATTKAFVNGVIILYLLSKFFKNKEISSAINPLKRLKKSIKEIINSQSFLNEIVNELYLKKDCYFIGRDIDYPLQLEAGLKLKEISYINCLSIPSGELKHGTLALIDSCSIIFASITQKRLLDKNLSNIKEIEARKGKVYLFTTIKNVERENTFIFDHISPELDVLELVVLYQLLALKVCLKKGLSPDKPRNLAKSVTVE